MDRILITGISGQDGVFLTSKLFSLNNNIKIYGISRNINNPNFYKKIAKINKNFNLDNIQLINTNLFNYIEVSNLISDLKPTVIINLAGPSSVSESINNEQYYKVHLEDSFDNIANSVISLNLKTKIFQASSSEMFDNSEDRLNEQSALKPRNPYSNSKYKIHLKIEQLREHSGLNISSGIMFNHESEFRSKQFLVMNIIQNALRIKRKEIENFKIGSIDYVRDWSFAGDIMDAVLQIIMQDNLEDFVLGSGEGTQVRHLLEYVFSFLNLNWEEHVEIDKTILRKNDPLSIVSNPEKILNKLGWKAEMDIEKLLFRMIENIKSGK